MEKLHIENCCGEYPTIKQKTKKGELLHTIECKSCGLIIGNFNDSFQAFNNWNFFHTMKEQGEAK
jgi:hypothetical protein